MQELDFHTNNFIEITRASFDEQKTAYCTVLEGVLVTGEEFTLLLGNADDAFKSSVPSVGRFVFISKLI